MVANAPQEFGPELKDHPRPWVVAAITAVFAFPFLLWGVSWALAPHPIRYEVDTRELRIYTARGFTGDVKRIPLERIEAAAQEWLRGGELRMGTEKAGYCVGFFHYSHIGEVWQATDGSNEGVSMKVRGEVVPVIVVSPADRDGFVSAVLNATAGQFATVTAPRAFSATTFLLFAFVFWPLGAALTVLLLLAPRRTRYRISHDQVEVETIFARRAFPLAGARARRHQPLLGEKLSGFAAPGFYAGTFEFDKAPTNVFASNVLDGVLIEKDERLFVTPRDRDAFLAALAAAGASVR